LSFIDFADVKARWPMEQPPCPGRGRGPPAIVITRVKNLSLLSVESRSDQIALVGHIKVVRRNGSNATVVDRVFDAPDSVS